MLITLRKLGKLFAYASKSGVYFAAPALLYTIYNNLMFINLTNFNPPTYRILINLRILWSGLLASTFLKHSIGLRKWIALILLMFGCSVTAFTYGVQAVSMVPLFLMVFQVSTFNTSLFLLGFPFTKKFYSELE